MIRDRMAFGNIPASPPTPKSRLVGERTADVVGAGCTGCSAALHLAQARARSLWWRSGNRLRRVRTQCRAGECRHGDHAGRPGGRFRRGTWRAAARHAGQGSGRRAAPMSNFSTSTRRAARRGSPVYSAALFDRRAGTIQPLVDIRGLGGAAVAAGEIFTASSVSASARQGRTTTARCRWPRASTSTWRKRPAVRRPGCLRTGDRTSVPTVRATFRIVCGTSEHLGVTREA